MAIHEDQNNPHCHLMFTERGRKDDLSPDKYFSRSNAKDRSISQKAWLVEAKETYLAEIRTVVPSYTPSYTQEPKIGPSMKQAVNTYENNKKKRIEEVELLRWAAKAVRALDATIERLELAEQESAAGVASKSTYTPPMGAPPIPKLISPLPVGRGLDTALNVDGFAPSRVVAVSKPTASRLRR